jgi:SpoVK/Ycf46/Vps4 family AAA+-type ATPase
MCQYAGPAPVSLRAYQKSVLDQRPQVTVNQASLRLAFGELVVTDRLLDQLGPALVAQTSIFLYGPAGTGKTSLAERLLRVYGDQLVMPYAVEVDSQIVVLFDPAVHERVDIEIEEADPRWVVCHRPCVIVGGELIPSMLELRLDESSGTYAPPVQMKANGGMLVIDDFGRQLISPRDLLNRWIVPLDRRIDYLSLNYGVRFHIPFEVMIVFATNLEPSELADEAFLRRIPNKLLVDAVAPDVFDEIFRRVMAKYNMPCDPGVYEHLRKLCIARGGDLRPSYPRDMCRIIQALKTYEEQPLRVGPADLERAVDLFFGTMQSGHSG